RAALACLGLAAVALAGNIRAEQWRGQRLPEIAAEQRLAAQQARVAEQRASARREWTAMERADASTRFLCAAAQVAAVRRGGVAVASISADAQGVTLALPPGAETAALRQALRLPQAETTSAEELSL